MKVVQIYGRLHWTNIQQYLLSTAAQHGGRRVDPVQVGTE